MPRGSRGHTLRERPGPGRDAIREGGTLTLLAAHDIDLLDPKITDSWCGLVVEGTQDELAAAMRRGDRAGDRASVLAAGPGKRRRVAAVNLGLARSAVAVPYARPDGLASRDVGALMNPHPAWWDLAFTALRMRR